jgi:hypothetical protein
MIEPDAWRAASIPLLRNPRALLKRLHALHRPEAGTAVVAVLDATGHPVASASFAIDDGLGPVDGWRCRNILLAQLRLIVADDLRRATPVRTAVLLLCRDGGRGWEPDDGRWMWGLRDACSLHGLRCGAVVVLAEDGWQVIGDGRSGRTPVPVAPTPPPAPTPLPRTAPEPTVRAPDHEPSRQASRRPKAPSGAPPLPVVATRTDSAAVAVAVAAAVDHEDRAEDLGLPAHGPVVRLVPDVDALRCS